MSVYCEIANLFRKTVPLLHIIHCKHVNGYWRNLIIRDPESKTEKWVIKNMGIPGSTTPPL